MHQRLENMTKVQTVVEDYGTALGIGVQCAGWGQDSSDRGEHPPSLRIVESHDDLHRHIR